MVAIPRLVIAAPASGCGKTTVACGLMAALRARGLAVSGHKVGPDYIDPGYHALATGRPPRNLDPFLCGEELIAPLFRHGAAGAQVAVVEGVMGLFDGADPATVPGQEPGFGSTAHVARLLGAPVVLVVDAARAGRSVAALVAGFAAFDPRTPVAGVILNRVASDRHERLLRDALASSGIAVYGAIRRIEGIVTPSRHLGLIPAAERAAEASQAVIRIGDLIAASCDIDALLALAREAPALPGPAWEPRWASVRPLLVRRSRPAAPGWPLLAPSLPWRAGRPSPSATPSSASCSRRPAHRWLPSIRCGTRTCPKGRAGSSSAGDSPRCTRPNCPPTSGCADRVAALARRGTPLAAECAGLLYLARTLDGRPMCGVLDVQATMTAKLTLGYRQATAVHDSVLAAAGDRVRGHEFHRTAVRPVSGARAAWRFGSGELEGHVTGSGVASYLHTHWAGHPAAAARFAAAAARACGHETGYRGGVGVMKRLIGVGSRPGRSGAGHDKGRPGASRGRRSAGAGQAGPDQAGPEPEPGRAETIIRAYVDADRIKRVPFALNDTGGVTPRRAAAWRAAATAVAAEFAAGASTVAFGTLGDPNLYSTFSYLAQTVRDLVPGVEVRTLAGITAMQDLASRAGISLAEGTEPVTLVPLNGGVSAVDQALASGGTVVGYKVGAAASPSPGVLRDRLHAAGRLDGAVIGARLGLTGELIAPAARFLASAQAGPDIPYLSTLIVPATRLPGTGSGLASVATQALPAAEGAC